MLTTLKGVTVKKVMVLLIPFALLMILFAGCGNEKEDYKNKAIEACNDTMAALEGFQEWLDTSYNDATADATEEEVSGLVEELETSKAAIEATTVPSDATKTQEEILDWYDSCIKKAEDISLMKSYSEIADKAYRTYYEGRTIVADEVKNATTNDAIYSVFSRASAKYKEALVLFEKATPPAVDCLQQFHKDFLDILNGFIAATDNIVVAVQTNNVTLMSQSLNELDTVAIKNEHLIDTPPDTNFVVEYVKVKDQLPEIVDKLNAL